MPTSKSGSSSSRGGGSARKRAAAASERPWQPVLRGADGIVPGEVLVTLSPEAADAMTSSVPLHPAGVAGAVHDLGVDDLDAVLADLGAHDITRLAPSSVGIAGVAALDGDDLGLLDGPSHILSRTFRVRLSTDVDVTAAVDRLTEVDSVEVAEPNRWRETMVTPNDPQFGSQWGLTKINAPAAWDISTGSPTAVVGVVDTGCDLDHPELAPLLVNGYDMVDLGPNPTPPPGWRFEGDFAGRDPIPEDEVGHGTHVSGTIAALSDNGVQVAGVGWQTRIMPVKALTRMVRISDGRVSGVGSSADVAAAIRWAADHGAHVINMSLGADQPTTVEGSAVAYAIGKGVVVVAAMGNDGTSNPSYPAAYPGVVAVGALDSADKKASFSQTGPHISLAAPGVGIVSTYLAGGTASLSGTSMATPHVAGVAALIKAVKPSATGTEIADILRDTARPLTDNPGDPVPNDSYGHGCLDAHAAVLKARGTAMPPLTKLRTPVLWCPPTVHQRWCQPIPPRWPVTQPPWTITQPPMVHTVPTQQVGPGVAAAGYDPYGLLGGGAGEAQGGERSYQAGYTAGYAAAMAEVEAAVLAAESGAEPAGAEAAGAEAAGAGSDVQAGPGGVFHTFPFPRHPFPRSLFLVCVPNTLGTPFCPIPKTPITTIPTTPYQPGGGYGYGQQVGYDPYGQSPFRG